MRHSDESNGSWMSKLPAWCWTNSCRANYKKNPLARIFLFGIFLSWMLNLALQRRANFGNGDFQPVDKANAKDSMPSPGKEEEWFGEG